MHNQMPVEPVLEAKVDSRATWRIGVKLVDDLRRAWEGKRPTRAVDVLEQHPRLASQKQFVLDLAYEEYVQRALLGQRVDALEFSRDFPAYRESVARLIEVSIHLDRLAREDLQSQDSRYPTEGETWCDFRLQAPLGRGAFARVFLANQIGVGQRAVAIKLSTAVSDEADTLGKLKHANIVAVHCVEHDPLTGLSGICMDYAGQVTLADVLDAMAETRAPRLRGSEILHAITSQLRFAEPVPPPLPDPALVRGTFLQSVLHLGAQLADALAYAHGEGICHHDLKPSNVVLASHGRPMLVDFNLAFDEQLGRRVLGGTLPYMAPEQIRSAVLEESDGADLGQAADVFSWGVIVHELLHGAHPFGVPPRGQPTQESARELWNAQRTGPLPLLDRFASLEPKLADLLARSMAFEADQRPTAAELAEEVRALLQPAAKSSHAARRSGRNRWRTAVTLAASAGVLAGVMAWREHTLPKRAWRDAVTSFANKDYQNCALQLAPLIEEEPRNVDALLTRALACLQAGDYAQALSDTSAARELSTNLFVQACHAACLGRTGNTVECRQCYLDLLRRGMSSSEVQTGLGASEMNLEHLDRARNHADQALLINPNYWPALYLRALLEYKEAVQENRACRPDGLNDILLVVHGAPPRTNAYGMAARMFGIKMESNDERMRQAEGFLRIALQHGADPQWMHTEPHLAELFRRAPDLAEVAKHAVHDWPRAFDLFAWPFDERDLQPFAERGDAKLKFHGFESPLSSQPMVAETSGRSVLGDDRSQAP